MFACSSLNEHSLFNNFVINDFVNIFLSLRRQERQEMQATEDKNQKYSE